jgi:hypothetical protein
MHSSHGTFRGNSACTALESEFLVASGDIGHLELNWLAATGRKPRFVIGHGEDFTVPTNKNVNVRTDALNRLFGNDASNAAAKHFWPHTESTHFCFQGLGAKFEMVLHHLCIVFHAPATSNVVHREPFVFDEGIEVRGWEANNASVRHQHSAGVRRDFRVNGAFGGTIRNFARLSSIWKPILTEPAKPATM